MAAKRKKIPARKKAPGEPPKKITRAPTKRTGKPGRPGWIGTTREEVVALASRGLTMEQIADALQINVRQFFRYKAKDGDLDKWIREGRALGIKSVANHLFNAAGTGNVTAMIFYLKARAGWRDQDAPAAIDPQDVARHMTEMLQDIEAQTKAAK